VTFASIVTEQKLLELVAAMRDHVDQFISPICATLEDETGVQFGKVVGSGTFVSLRGEPWIVTNEHVARAQAEHVLAHFRGNDMYAAAIVHGFVCLSPPEDMALARIEPSMLEGAEKIPLPLDRVATEFSPIEGEVLFVMGYPGKRSHFSALAGGLQTWPLPFATDVAALPEGTDNAMFFALDYPAGDQVVGLDGKRTSLSEPKGLSGSLVWNTRYVQRGNAWTPADAVVCGILQLWDQGNQLLIGVKANVFRGFLLDALRVEASRKKWESRGSPPGEEWSDMPWAEETITGIE